SAFIRARGRSQSGPTPISSSSTPSGGRPSPPPRTTPNATTASTREPRWSAPPRPCSCAATSSSRTASPAARRERAASYDGRSSASRSRRTRQFRRSAPSRAFFTSDEQNCASVVGVLGFVIGARRGRLGLLAGLAIALTAILSVSASDAATTRAKGIDVSTWNGTINWTKVAHAGYRFAFGKATEGTSYNDKTYTTNRHGSEGAGLVFGAYHFARPSGKGLAAATASAIKQANHFLAVAGPQPGELPPVLDLEKTGNLSKQRLLAWTLAWLGQIEARTGVEPFLYTSPLFWKGNLGDSTAAAAAGTGLWIAHWTSSSKPLVPAPTRTRN